MDILDKNVLQLTYEDKLETRSLSYSSNLGFACNNLFFVSSNTRLGLAKLQGIQLFFVFDTQRI